MKKALWSIFFAPVALVMIPLVGITGWQVVENIRHSDLENGVRAALDTDYLWNSPEVCRLQSDLYHIFLWVLGATIVMMAVAVYQGYRK